MLISRLITPSYLNVSFQQASSPRTMKLLLPFIFLLALFNTLHAIPVPQTSPPPTPQKKGISWRTWLPIAGTVAFLGGLATFVYLGTHSEESYKSAKASSLEQKLASLPPEERKFIETRHVYLGKNPQDLDPGVVHQLKNMDQEHEFPEIQMPQLKALDRKTEKEVKAVYGKLQGMMKEVRETEAEKREAEKGVENAANRRKSAQRQAAVFVAMELKEAYRKAGITNPWQK
jgi:hypothetical protein